MASKKLGQPVPFSFLAVDSKSGRWHTAQMKAPRASRDSALMPYLTVQAALRIRPQAGEPRDVLGGRVKSGQYVQLDILAGFGCPPRVTSSINS